MLMLFSINLVKLRIVGLGTNSNPLYLRMEVVALSINASICIDYRFCMLLYPFSEYIKTLKVCKELDIFLLATVLLTAP
jgi:hypothetical protein